MSAKWLKAAVRYEMAKLSGSKPRKKVEKPAELVPTLKRFLESDEWHWGARKLLVATGLHVLLGVKGPSDLRTLGVVLDGDGLKKYERDKYKPIGVQEANRFLAKIHKDNPLFDPVLHIRQELDRIADEAP